MDNIVQNHLKDQQELLVRIERNHRMVQRLSEKLNSYTYEPKCPERFEKYYQLNRSIQKYYKNHNSIMSKIRQGKFNMEFTDLGIIDEHLERFKKLESEFAAYLLDLKMPL
ncbi:hypothetical protein [Allomuricauda sp. F6463D]|uniref:hypothetical protein n=1 Tax=Allomuricauda sp. F6463D TaxID=2926409 RepID=UPI001FF3EB2D|nr:hypothetical protein [Muricauda sp. F6463D]MCK0159600.1 hypothetical protein [Muricauda sp. F6463D]